MRRRSRAVGAVAAVAAVLLLLSLLLLERGAVPGARSVPAPGGPPGDAEAGAGASPRAPLPPPARGGDALPLAAAPGDGVPESVRRALGTLTGRLVQADGRPAAGLPVAVAVRGHPRQPLEIAASLPLPGRARTGADGRFSLDALPPATPLALLVDPGGARPSWHALDAMAVSAREVDVGDIVLPAVAWLAGRVVDPDGQPAAGVRVLADAPGLPALSELPALPAFRPGDVLAKGPSPWRVARWGADLVGGLPLPVTVTGADGRFELPVAPLPSLALSAAAAVGPPVRRVLHGLVAGERVDVGDLRLPPFVSTEGVVVDGDGESLAGATVFAGNVLSAGEGLLLRGTVADGDGRFLLELAAGRARCFVAVREGAFLHEGPEFVAGEALRVVIAEVPPLQLTVLGADGGVPERVTVRARQDVLHASDRSSPLHDVSHLLAARGDGRWTLPLGPPDGCVLEVGAAGYRPVRRALGRPGNAPEGAPPPEALTFTLPRERTLRVTVVDARDGAPVEGASVRALPLLFDGSDEDGLDVRTDARGVAVLPEPDTGRRAALVVRHPAYAPTFVDGVPSLGLARAAAEPDDVTGTRTLRVELLSALALTGEVRGAEGCHPLRVVAFCLPGVPAGVLRPDVLGQLAAFHATALTGDDGRFVVRGLAPGEAYVAVTAPTPRGVFAGAPVIGSLPWVETRVVLAADREHHVVLDLAAAGRPRVQGRLVVDGEPAAGWSVLVEDDGQWLERVDVGLDGAFRTGPLPSGRGTLAACLPGASGSLRGRFASRTVTAADPSALPLSWKLVSAPLAGEVVEAGGGEPVPGALVLLEPADERHSSLRAFADDGGRFVFARVHPGAYRLRLATDRLQGSLDDVTVPCPEPVRVLASPRASGAR